MKEILKEYVHKKIELDGQECILEQLFDSYFIVNLNYYVDEDSGSNRSCYGTYIKYIPYTSILEIIIENREYTSYRDENDKEIFEYTVLIIRLIIESLLPPDPSDVKIKYYKKRMGRRQERIRVM